MIGKTNAQQLGGGGLRTDGEYMITVVDYDGTVLKQEFLDNGEEFELPSAPDHTSDGLVFDGWSSPVVLTADNKFTVTNTDVTIGPMYDTASGYSELIVVVGAGYNLTLNSGLSGERDWGDGTVDSNTSHTYTNAGKYKITLKGTFTDFIIPTSIETTKCLFKEMRISGSVTTIKGNAIYQFNTVDRIVVSKKVTTLENSCFGYNSFNVLILPTSITITPQNLMNSSKVEYLVIPYGVLTMNQALAYSCSKLKSITIPTTVTTFTASSIIYDCGNIKSLTIPNQIKDIPAMGNMSNLVNFKFASDITSLGSLNNAFKLKELNLPNTVTTLSYYSTCYNIISMTVPPLVTILNSQFLQYCYSLIELICLGDITEIKSGATQGQGNCMKYDFTHCTSVPTLGSSNFTAINSNAKIYVPASLETSWKTATNWANVAAYIVGV